MNYVVQLRKAEKSARPLVRAVCIYEFVALTLPKNRYTPPLSVIFNKHKWLLPVFGGLLAAHVWWLEN